MAPIARISRRGCQMRCCPRGARSEGCSSRGIHPPSATATKTYQRPGGSASSGPAGCGDRPFDPSTSEFDCTPPPARMEAPSRPRRLRRSLRLSRTIVRGRFTEDALHSSSIPDPRAVEHRMTGVLLLARVLIEDDRSPSGCVERYQHHGWPERTCVAPPAERTSMLARTHHSPAALSRRSHAQRRLRRAASSRLFCSTNGCTTFLVPADGGGRAVCPVCGLERKLRSSRNDGLPALSN